MISYGKHHTRVPGIEEFAAWLDKVPGVDKVIVTNFRTRKVGPGKGEPKFFSKRHHVEVRHNLSGSIQVVRVFPQRVVDTEDLRNRLVQAWNRQNSRGGIGMSPRDEVVIPESIRRQQALGRTATRAEPPPSPRLEATTNHVPAAKPETGMTDRTTLTDNPPQAYTLSPLQAQVYSYLLGLDPTGQLRFTVDRVFGKVAEGTKLRQNQVSSIVQGLKKLGLIRAMDFVTTGYASQKRFEILRRPFQTSAAHIVSKRTPVGRSEPETTGPDSIEQHLRFFAKHGPIIEEADRRRKALAKKGFEIVKVGDRVAIVPKR